MDLAFARSMSYRTMRERHGALMRERRGVLVGAALTLAFGGLATLVASLVQSAGTMLVLSVLGLIAAGLATSWIRPAAHPLEPAVGAGAAILLFSLVQIALTPQLRDELGWGQIATSLLVSVLFAFSLAWIGALIGHRHRLRSAPASRRYGAPPQVRDRDRIGAGSPESRPAPHSG